MASAAALLRIIAVKPISRLARSAYRRIQLDYDRGRSLSRLLNPQISRLSFRAKRETFVRMELRIQDLSLRALEMPIIATRDCDRVSLTGSRRIAMLFCRVLQVRRVE
jgi:hypothetical protein